MNSKKQNIERQKRHSQNKGSDLLFIKDIASSANPGPAFVFISIFVRSKNVSLDIDM
jgi:hypothetical protein